jgi:hypothetical protein
MNGFIGHPDSKRPRISVRIDSHSCNTHVPSSSDDTAGDFAPIGDEDFRKHDEKLSKHVAARNG